MVKFAAVGMRLGMVLVVALAAAGCHTGPVIVIANTASSTGTSSGGSTTGNASSTGTSTGANTGTSTGTIIAPVAPSFLLDAGPNTVFGPIAIANGSSAIGYSGARLVYALGDGGEFGVNLFLLADDASPLQGPELVAEANTEMRSDAGGVAAFAPPPRVAVATYQTGTAVCWEDFSEVINPAQTGCNGTGPAVRCATLDEQGDDPQSSYAGCGTQPRLVFNPTDLVTQLIFSGGAWTYGATNGTSIDATDYWGAGAFAGGPISSGQDVVLTASAPTSLQPSVGLLLLPVPYTTFGYGVTAPPEAFNLDATFDGDGGFAASSNFGSQILSVLELDGAGLRTAAWQFDAGVRQIQTLPYSQPTVGPIAAGTCPKGFGYLAITDGGQALFAEEAFEGGFLPGSGILIALPGFNSTITNAAVATQPGGGLLLAIASPAQIAVYFIQGCQ